MKVLPGFVGCLLALIVSSVHRAKADGPSASSLPASDAASAATALLTPPKADGPLELAAAFQLQNINAINDENLTFEFTGVLTLQWHDPRLSFDPKQAGVTEKIYQGNYQFNELYPGWFPQEVLVNGSGLYEKSGVILRVRSDGTLTLVQTINAVARDDFSVVRFPFDGQTLEAEFEILGYDNHEVVFRPAPEPCHVSPDMVQVPQWKLGQVSIECSDRVSTHLGRRGVASSLKVRIDVHRKPFFIIRLVVLPLTLIVLLSFCVFWMDRSSVGDRISVSFIGILTGVAYQIVVSDLLPQIATFTLIHAFLNISFLTMCGTVVVNLRVAVLDRRGHREAGDLLDRRCRWIFPLAYFAHVMLAALGAFWLL